jgi:DNA-binding protein H-NS
VIHGIPEQKEEDNVENVIKLGQLLEVNLTRGDIDIVHRMKTKSESKPRPIIARFSNYNAKSKLYEARLNLRNVTLQDLGAEKIFTSENLTAWRAKLFKEARKVRKKFYNGKTWTVDGKIFLKTDFTAKVLKVDSYEDLKGL